MLKALITPLFFCFLLISPPQAVIQESGKSDIKARLIYHANSLKTFAESQGCSDRLGVLIDMSIASRKKRFFVVNLQNDSVLVSGLCAHGQGDDVNREEVVFSNTPGSNCTSEGRYKLGVKFEGDYGTGYILHGLDSTNNNALKREVVFHYYFKVGDKEDENVVCRSNGCPMVSQTTFRATEKLIDAESKPVLMWIYK